MSIHIELGLQKIHEELLRQFGLVEQMIENAVRALCDRRSDLIPQVIENDAIIDRRELEIEEECLKFQALNQPVAGDLRQVTTAYKINAIVERIGDLARAVAVSAQQVSSTPYFPIPDELPELSRHAIAMVRNSLDSFCKSDLELAQQVIDGQSDADSLTESILEELESLMRSDSSQVTPALEYYSSVRHLERIVSLARNIAASVVYMISGQLARTSVSK